MLTTLVSAGEGSILRCSNRQTCRVW